MARKLGAQAVPLVFDRRVDASPLVRAEVARAMAHDAAMRAPLIALATDAEAAVAAFSRLRFRPGEIQGVAVSSESRFEVAFNVREVGSSHATDRGAGRP